MMKHELIKEAESIAQELNALVNWLSYSGCTSRSLTVN